MLYTLNPAISSNTTIRLWGIFGFALLTGIGANISIPWQPVPFTLQVFFVLLAGLTLGARDGLLSQATYLGLIAVGLPLAANGVGGAAAFSTPSTGYLLAFVPAAGLVGLLAARNTFMLSIACISGIALIYLIGASYLKNYLAISWEQAWEFGVAPFLAIDLAKAVVAAAMGESARQWWLRQQTGGLN